MIPTIRNTGRLALLGVITSLAPVDKASGEERIFSPIDFGAKSDGVTIDTKAIQSAIDAAESEGGGRVVLADGVYRSGSIFLKQGVAFEVAKGATLLGSNSLDDYPKEPTRIEGHTEPWRLALINGKDLKDVEIGGEGTVDGNGIMFWAAFWQRRKENENCTNLEVERPRILHLDGCEKVSISDLRVQNSGFWNLHVYRCQDVTIEGVSIYAPGQGAVVRAPSSDGIDIDSCQRVVVRKCKIEVDDDCIAIKGSKGPLANKDADSPPVEDILVEDCEFPRGHGVVTLGSEATLVRNVIVRRCVVGGSNNLVRLKLRPDTPQRYENLVYEDITLKGDQGAIFAVKPWTQFFDLKGHEPPKSEVFNVTLRNVKGSFGTWGDYRGNKGDVIGNLVIENVDLKLANPKLDVGLVNGVTVKDVKVNGKDWQFPEDRVGPEFKKEDISDWDYPELN